jgi:serine O-acetyltransferase
MGIVIGETADIGDNVNLLQGVTLGGTSTRREKRHPTLRDNVTVGSGAKIIGAITVGENSRVGAGSVVVRDVPPNAVVVGVPGRVTSKDGQRVGGIDMNMTDLPDPVSRAIEQLVERIRGLEADLDSLRKQVDRDGLREEDRP